MAMLTRGRVVWPFLMLCGVLIAAGARGACDSNSINYAGNYNLDGFGHSSIDEKGNATRTEDFKAVYQIFPAPPNSAGSREYSYWMRRYVGDTVNISVTNPVVESVVEAVSELGPADTICVAPPFESAGLRCVDLEDAGINQLTPLEVDADCNLIKAWGSYMEPKTPGCEGPLCYPIITYGVFTRLGSETTESIPLANSSGGGQYSYHAVLVVLLLLYAML